MFNDLDDTLKKLLTDQLPKDMAVISFETPDSDFSMSVNKPTINIFLYEVRENLELRSTEWHVEKAFDSVNRKSPPMRVECLYLITSWTAGTQAKPQDEHRLLGEVMKVLLRNRRYPDSVLKGSLEKGETVVLRTQSLQSDNVRIGEFWQAMGGKPRVAINYQVTLSFNVREPLESKMITEKVEIRINKDKDIISD